MSKHTPTPWRVEQDTTQIWGSCDPDDNSSRGMGYPVTECRIIPAGSWAKGPDYDEGEANAAFIVLAVNSHDALVEALNGLVGAVEREAKIEGVHGIACDSLPAARAALALVQP